MRKTLLYQQKKISYRITGTGKPVLLLHGFGEDSSVWDAQVRYLEDRFRIIVPDLPGTGDSEVIDDMTMEGMAEVIKAIVDFEALGKISLIGHSMGGYIALAFFEKYGEVVSGLGLFHSSAFADNEDKKAARQKGIAFVKQHGAFAFLETVIPNLFSPQSRDASHPSVEKLLQAAHNFSPEALVSYYQAMIARPKRTDLLVTTRIPVLFIMGKYDTAVPIEDSLQQCHLPEKSYIHVLQKYQSYYEKQCQDDHEF